MKSKLALLFLLTSAVAYGGCQVDTSDYRDYEAIDVGAGPGPIKLFHVKGTHFCQSQEAFYKCDVEMRDATDCQNGHVRLRSYPYSRCCKETVANGKVQKDGNSINYVAGSCSPLF